MCSIDPHVGVVYELSGNGGNWWRSGDSLGRLRGRGESRAEPLSRPGATAWVFCHSLSLLLLGIWPDSRRP